MRHALHSKIICASALLLAVAWPLAANASAQLAVDHGCYNCHGPNLRGEAPSMERLAEKLSKYKGDSAAQQKFVDKYRAGEMFGHIDAHERLSLESATALVRWLAEGGK
ncbi:MAG TPA: c-type cytochrome [Rhodoferax sp.]